MKKCLPALKSADSYCSGEPFCQNLDFGHGARPLEVGSGEMLTFGTPQTSGRIPRLGRKMQILRKRLPRTITVGTFSLLGPFVEIPTLSMPEVRGWSSNICPNAVGRHVRNPDFDKNASQNNSSRHVLMREPFLPISILRAHGKRNSNNVDFEKKASQNNNCRHFFIAGAIF